MIIGLFLGLLLVRVIIITTINSSGTIGMGLSGLPMIRVNGLSKGSPFLELPMT